jgi:hypothetical protein
MMRENWLLSTQGAVIAQLRPHWRLAARAHLFRQLEISIKEGKNLQKHPSASAG